MSKAESGKTEGAHTQTHTHTRIEQHTDILCQCLQCDDDQNLSHGLWGVKAKKRQMFFRFRFTLFSFLFLSVFHPSSQLSFSVFGFFFFFGFLYYPFYLAHIFSSRATSSTMYELLSDETVDS